MKWIDGKKDRSYLISAPVVIEGKAWLGFNAIVLKGVTVGEGSIVAAESVVTKNALPGVIVAGNPAQVVREIESGDTRVA